MQDLFGIRIAVYFQDDQALCRRIIEDRFSVVSITEDRPDADTFEAPTRLNFICKLPMSCRQELPSAIYDHYPIDTTVEIQLRTVFSEGWHEVEHDLRYKSRARLGRQCRPEPRPQRHFCHAHQAATGPCSISSTSFGIGNTGKRTGPRCWKTSCASMWRSSPFPRRCVSFWISARIWQQSYTKLTGSACWIFCLTDAFRARR